MGEGALAANILIYHPIWFKSSTLRLKDNCLFKLLLGEKFQLSYCLEYAILSSPSVLVLSLTENTDPSFSNALL